MTQHTAEELIDLLLRAELVIAVSTYSQIGETTVTVASAMGDLFFTGTTFDNAVRQAAAHYSIS